MTVQSTANSGWLTPSRGHSEPASSANDYLSLRTASESSVPTGIVLLAGLLLLLSWTSESAAGIAAGTGWFTTYPPSKGYPNVQAAIDGLSAYLKANGCVKSQGPNYPLEFVETRYVWSVYPLSGNMQAWCHYQGTSGVYPGSSLVFSSECPGNTVSPTASLSSPTFIACVYPSSSRIPSKEAGPYCPSAENPINIASGNKWQSEADYIGVGTNALT